MNDQCLLDISGLSVNFFTDEGVVEAVKDLSFHIDQGETVAVVGESGSGKSVTSLATMRLIPSPPGKIVAGNISFRKRSGEIVAIERANERTMRGIRGNDIAMIFQEPMTSLNPVYTVGDQIAEAIVLHQKKTTKQALRIATEMLELVEIPEPAKRVKHYPHQMSGGMRQRVMIAMALSCRPALLIADEPTTALDVIIQAEILDLMRKLRSEIDMSMLFITHDLGVVAEIADRVVVMNQGEKVEEGTVNDIFDRPLDEYTIKLLEAVPRIDADKPAPEQVQDPNILMQVKNLRTWFPIRGGILSRTLGHVKAVDDVSFDIRRGEVLGLVGESGSGKTTAGRSILRLIEPTGGEVLYDGVDLAKLSKGQMRAYRRKMQIIFQDPYASLNPRMTVADIVGESLVIHKLCKTKQQRIDRVVELLELVGLEAWHLRRYPHEFSGGQRQRIGIARALAVEPDFIVADECVSALDVSIQAQVLDLLRDLREKLDLTMLFISHDLAVVEEISDRVAVMYKGKLVEVQDAHRLYRDPQHNYTKALLSSVPIPDPNVQRERIHWDGVV
ncbi:MAG: ABC transporter ATP-binding protein [Deinococcota bacterium]